ncbi:hypothetical protein BJX76DRAFT_338118 [Aspergillus varians]
MSEVTPAWTTLNRFLPSRTADLDYWWKFSGRHLAIILDAAQYPMEKQYETLLFHYHWGVRRTPPLQLEKTTYSD